jgi:hypothetical protein
MILGRGNIASIIEDRKGFIFFACGESNRNELTHNRKITEINKLLNIYFSNHPDRMFVYFSGLNIYYQDKIKRNDYTEHKLHVEDCIKASIENYCIIRLGSITWGDNPNTLLNVLKRKVKEDENYIGEPVYRYLNSKEEVRHWCNMVPEKGKHEMNITGRMVFVPDLINEIKQGLYENM